MTKVLVLGGTRFFGKRLVEKWIGDGADITILTRGQREDSFGDCVKRLHADRTDINALRQVLGDKKFDIVYDNICYSAKEAEEAVQLFSNRTPKYVVTSSLSVYPFGGPEKKETDFDPYNYSVPKHSSAEVDYAEGKRLVEAVLFQQAPFSVSAVRFPIVLGHDDYTRRLHFHVEHIQEGQALGIPNPNASLSFIPSDEAASFLFWLGKSSLTGPVNACSRGEITPERIVGFISEAVGRQAIVLNETEKEHESPFGIPESWVMETSKAESAGYTFQQLEDWLPRLIREIAAAR